MATPYRPIVSALVLTLFVGGFGSAVHAQQVPQARDEPATKFERFLLSKGTVTVREYYDVGSLKGIGSAKLEVARAYTPGQKDYFLALRIEVTESGRLSRERVGTLDAEEVRSLASAIPQMSKMIEVLKQGQEAESTEVGFKGGSVQIGFFVSRLRSSGTNESLFIRAGDIAAVTAYFELSEMGRLEALVNQAATKIGTLQQGR